jgi:hypothetical protein
VTKLQRWRQQGAEIVYLSSHRKPEDVEIDKLVLGRHGFPMEEMMVLPRSWCYPDSQGDNMDTFAQAVDGWHDFYLMVGAAAATLVGLLFVSLSLNVDVITRQENAHLRVLAAQTFTGFLNVIMFAVLFLIPSQVPLGLGLPLLGISGYGLYETAARFMKTRRARPRGWGRGSIARRFVVPTLCFVAILAIAVSVLLGQTGGLYWLVPVMILLIVAASRNAWDLLLGLREPPMES